MSVQIAVFKIPDLWTVVISYIFYATNSLNRARDAQKSYNT